MCNAEEEKEIGHSSPQIDDANAGSLPAKRGLRHGGKSTFEESYAKSGQPEPVSQVKTCTATPEECPNTDDQATTDNNMNSSQNQLSGFCDQITVEDVLCAGCNELLFWPVVLNCGHGKTALILATFFFFLL